MLPRVSYNVCVFPTPFSPKLPKNCAKHILRLARCAWGKGCGSLPLGRFLPADAEPEVDGVGRGGKTVLCVAYALFELLTNITLILILTQNHSGYPVQTSSLLFIELLILLFTFAAIYDIIALDNRVRLTLGGI